MLQTPSASTTTAKTATTAPGRARAVEEPPLFDSTIADLNHHVAPSDSPRPRPFPLTLPLPSAGHPHLGRCEGPDGLGAAAGAHSCLSFSPLSPFPSPFKPSKSTSTREHSPRLKTPTQAPTGMDAFGAVFDVPLRSGLSPADRSEEESLNVLVHRGEDHDSRCRVDNTAKEACSSTPHDCAPPAGDPC